MISLKIKKILKKIFRVGPLFVGSVGLPETHIFFQSALCEQPCGACVFYNTVDRQINASGE